MRLEMKCDKCGIEFEEKTIVVRRERDYPKNYHVGCAEALRREGK